MLKNKEQRKQYLECEQNWMLYKKLTEIGMVIHYLQLPNERIIFRFTVSERQEPNEWNSNPAVREIKEYRLDHGSVLTDKVSMTYLIEMLQKIK